MDDLLDKYDPQRHMFILDCSSTAHGECWYCGKTRLEHVEHLRGETEEEQAAKYSGYQELLNMYLSVGEPSVVFTDGSMTNGECVGDVHVATGAGWCLCGKVREI